ncbi:ribosomal subunit 39S-domain-containing protein [Xylaria bambusicola]|uniref:ribosomal subunit 39S-domain-containing protein n=1 Tax=Xylaria bambusicola TaxID=326684 RepID=UPI0020077934|nr:ribosomal subunit 39S-domain-containing protein [Xylaria bambusicola]KAI0509749.1 ribosomal subunit 39S-domain-containing protein [Xylaria bambusicola]
MRRIPRLRRPSGLASSTTNNRSWPTPSPSHITPYSQRPAPSFSSSSQTGTPILASRTTPASFSSRLNRFYSTPSDKPQNENAPTTDSREILPHEPGTEVQPKISTPDEIVNQDDYDQGWTDAPGSVGPYTSPPERIEAPRVDVVGDPTYAPATTAEGLQTVGSVRNYWNRTENWTAAGDFVGFKPKEKVLEPALIEAAVRRAVIEAHALREVGREDDLVGVWPTTAVSKKDLQSLLAWDVKTGEDGSVVLGGSAEVVAEGVRWKDEEEGFVDVDSVLDGDELSADEAAALSQTWNPSWKSISLADPRIRFAITKRIFQLTGHRVPDHQLPSITSVQTLLHSLKKPPKPATFTQELQTRHPDLLTLPNVTVAPKRVTRGDKEIALGRFKLMQEEFKKRELPALGHGFVRKGKEISRQRGGL